MQIVFPSDIKLKINSVRDSEGTVISPSNYPYLIFSFVDDFGGAYRCIYDPAGTNSSGAKLVDDVLYVTIEQYKLKGKLSFKVGTKEGDEAFNDGSWKWYGEFKPLLDADGKSVEIVYA